MVWWAQDPLVASKSRAENMGYFSSFLTAFLISVVACLDAASSLKPMTAEKLAPITCRRRSGARITRSVGRLGSRPCRAVSAEQHSRVADDAAGVAGHLGAGRIADRLEAVQRVE